MKNAIDKNMVLDALPQPVLAVSSNWKISYANFAAQEFFGASFATLRKTHISDMTPFDSPVIGLIEQCLDAGASFNEYGIDLALLHNGSGHNGPGHDKHARAVDMHVTPVDIGTGPMHALIVIQPRSIAHHIDRQLTHRGAARSVSAMSAMLAHEIKNPLSGIKGAAQLLESEARPENIELTRLICDETDRIAGLVDQFEQFTETHANHDNAVNMHAVLENVRLLASNGFGQHVKFVEHYDPSLPPVLGNRDLLTQVFLNLVKNAAEAIDGKKGQGVSNQDKRGQNKRGEIRLVSSYRPGVRLFTLGRARPVGLPLEFSIIDNGIGVSEDIKSHLFDPFVTTKSTGAGLGLALVAKIIGDHGGTIDCESRPGRTVFCVRLPVASDPTGVARVKRKSNEASGKAEDEASNKMSDEEDGKHE